MNRTCLCDISVLCLFNFIYTTHQKTVYISKIMLTMQQCTMLDNGKQVHQSLYVQLVEIFDRKSYLNLQKICYYRLTAFILINAVVEENRVALNASLQNLNTSVLNYRQYNQQLIMFASVCMVLLLSVVLMCSIL